MIHKNTNNEWVLTSNGVKIVEPIFNKDIEKNSKKCKKYLKKKCEEGMNIDKILETQVSYSGFKKLN
jgi:hypothetical protein